MAEKKTYSDVCGLIQIDDVASEVTSIYSYRIWILANKNIDSLCILLLANVLSVCIYELPILNTKCIGEYRI